MTTVPQQQLFVLNSPFILQSARDLAARSSMTADDDRQRIQWIYRLAFARLPTTEELRDGQEFLAAVRHDLGEDQLTAWEQFAQAILAANEFSWID